MFVVIAVVIICFDDIQAMINASMTEQTESFDEEYEVKAGDVLIFAVNPEGNDSYDGGRLEIAISSKEEEPEEPSEDAYAEVTPDPSRTNNTSLKGSLGRHGKDGWYYGACDWDSKNFEKLPYDAEAGRYYHNGKPELKADFVEPGGGRNAAYKWVVAKDGTIQVKGDYTKFANNEDKDADGTCVRIFLNGAEKKWMGTTGNFSGEKTESFDLTFDVKAGDVLIFAVSPENNDNYDGGRLTVNIKDITENSGDSAKEAGQEGSEEEKQSQDPDAVPQEGQETENADTNGQETEKPEGKETEGTEPESQETENAEPNPSEEKADPESGSEG